MPQTRRAQEFLESARVSGGGLYLESLADMHHLKGQSNIIVHLTLTFCLIFVQSAAAGDVFLSTNADKPKNVYVSLSDNGDRPNFYYIESLAKIIEQINLGHGEEKIGLKILTAFPTLQPNQIPVKKPESFITIIPMGRDFPWTQDAFVLPWQEMNGKIQPFIFVPQKAENAEGTGPRMYESVAKIVAHSENMPVYLNGDKNSRPGANAGGDIGVTPNDVIYLGDSIGSQLFEFFSTRGYEQRMVRLNTSWLSVGHVDELISTVTTSDECGFALVVASPKEALDILRDSSHADPKVSLPQSPESDQKLIRVLQHPITLDPGSTIFKSSVRGAYESDTKRISDNLDRVLKLGTLLQGNETSNIVRMQELVQEIVNADVSVLKRKIAEVSPSCNSIKQINLPVLFSCRMQNGSTISDCASILPNQTNMLVLERQLVVPTSFFTPFDLNVEKKLNGFGQTVHWIDDRDYYRWGGDVHCSTQVLRVPHTLPQ